LQALFSFEFPQNLNDKEVQRGMTQQFEGNKDLKSWEKIPLLGGE